MLKIHKSKKYEWLALSKLLADINLTLFRMLNCLKWLAKRRARLSKSKGLFRDPIDVVVEGLEVLEQEVPGRRVRRVGRGLLTEKCVSFRTQRTF